MQLRNTISALWLAALCLGCEDLGEFKTGPHDVFRGEVVGSDSQDSNDSFIRRGFASHTMLELTFNPNASGIATTEDAGAQARGRAVPGKLGSYVCPAGATQCDESERMPGPFAPNTRLLAIDGLAHDTLSQYTFPGGGRLHNYIFSVRFNAETEDGRVARDAMIFVSLMETGHIEVRAIAPRVLAEDDKTERLPALFGVFVLRRDRL